MKIRGVNIPGREKKLCEAIRPEQGWPDQGTVRRPWASYRGRQRYKIRSERRRAPT